MHILFFILFSIFFIIFLVLRFFANLFRSGNNHSANDGQQKESRFTSTPKEDSKKVFKKNEGEYVEYEEINENNS